MSSIKNSQLKFQEHKSNVNIRKIGNIESRSESPVKYEKNIIHGKSEFQNVKYGYCEDTNDIKKSHSQYSRMGGNGMNSINSNNNGNVFKKNLNGHINETQKYKPSPRKVIPNNNKERPNAFNGYNKYSGPMKTRYSPPNEKSFEHNMQNHQAFSPKRIQTNTNNRQNRQSSSPGPYSPGPYSPGPYSPGQFSPQRSNSYQYNSYNRYPQQNYSEDIPTMSQMSPRGSKIIPSSSPMNQLSTSHGQYIPNNMNKTNKSFNKKIVTVPAVTITEPLKKKSSAIDIIDPETNEKKNFEKTVKINKETKSNLTEIKKQDKIIQPSGTETPVNEVTDTNNEPLEGSQMVESDTTETACETSDVEEEQVTVKNEVIQESEQKSEIKKATEVNSTVEEKVSESVKTSRHETTEIKKEETIKPKEEDIKMVEKKVNEKKEIVEKDVVEKKEANKDVVEKKDTIEKKVNTEKKDKVKKQEIVEKKKTIEKKIKATSQIQVDFKNILYPENIELPTIKNGVNIYSRAFLMLFRKLCTKAPANLDCPPVATKDSEKGVKKNNNNNNRNSKNSKNYHQNGNNNNNNNNNNNGFEHNNSKSNHSQKNMNGRSMSGSSRRGNVGRSFSRRQQQQPELPPVVPLQKSDNAWSRAKQINIEDAAEEEKRELIFRKVKGILNKLTLEKFDLLGKQVVNIGINDEIILKGIIKLIFDKAIDEPNFGSLYAKLCNYINVELPEIQSWVRIEEKKNNVFRRLMLNRCQEEFEKNIRWNEDAEETKPVAQMTDEEKIEYSRKISERTKKKRRALGNIRFIGELYMCQMITENIIHICFQTLFKNLNDPDEESVECLCFLLETVGAKVEKQAKLGNGMKKIISLKEWNNYFEVIDVVSKNKEIPSRMRFMLMDAIELKKNNWKSRINEAGPKTIAEIHKEAERELKEQEMKRNSSRSGSGRSSSTRSMDHGRNSRRGDSMSMRINQNKLDNNELNKFGKLESNNNKQIVLTPGGGNGSRYNFGKKKTTANRVSTVNTASPLSAHNNIFDALKDEEKNNEIVAEPVEDKSIIKENKESKEMDLGKAKKRIQLTFEEYVSQKDMNEAIESIKEIGTNKHNGKIVEIFINNYMDKKENEIKTAIELLVKLYEEKLLLSEDIIKEIKSIAEFIEDMRYDSPNVYNFFGLLISNLIKINAISFKSLKEICDIMKDITGADIPPSANLLGNTLKNLKSIVEESEFIKCWSSCNTSLKEFWYDNYEIEKMVNWVKNNKLECIYPMSTCFIELINKVGKEPSEEILKYIHSSVDEFTQASSEFICGVIQIAIINMKKLKLSTDEEKTTYIENLKPILQSLIQKESIQSEIMCSIEEVCRKSEDLMVLVFQILIKQEIIEKKLLKIYIEKSCKASEQTKSQLNELA